MRFKSSWPFKTDYPWFISIHKKGNLRCCTHGMFLLGQFWIKPLLAEFVVYITDWIVVSCVVTHCTFPIWMLQKNAKGVGADDMLRFDSKIEYFLSSELERQYF